MWYGSYFGSAGISGENGSSVEIAFEDEFV